MKLLRCKLCEGEVNIVDNERAVCKKIQCTKCGFTNLDGDKKKPVIILKKRNFVG